MNRYKESMSSLHCNSFLFVKNSSELKRLSNHVSVTLVRAARSGRSSLPSPPQGALRPCAPNHHHQPLTLFILIGTQPTTMLSTRRGLSLDSKINLIIGVLTIVIGTLSAILAWATWRLTSFRRVHNYGMSAIYREPEAICLIDGFYSGFS